MLINGILSLRDGEGDYILLEDNGGYEGLAVRDQYKTLEDAMAALASGGAQSVALVKLVRVNLEETNA